MTGLFVSILGLSLTASIAAAAVMAVRIPLKKAPKIYSYILWAVVLFRLLVPTALHSPFAIISAETETLPRRIIYRQEPSGVAAENLETDTVYKYSTDSSVAATLPVSALSTDSGVLPSNTAGLVVEIASWVWLAGIVLMLAYALYGYIGLLRRLQTAVLLGDNIFESDRINTAFVLGIFRPKIYLPLGLPGEQREYILAHERTHIRRFDCIIKPLAFLVLTVHWFNPVIWLSYALMTKDMEMSCDESVLKSSGSAIRAVDIRKGYSGSLLMLSARQSGLFVPLAFGESNVRSRVKNVLRYKKPAVWRVALATVFVLASMAGCMFTRDATTEPISEASVSPDGHMPVGNETIPQETEPTEQEPTEKEPAEPEIDPVVLKYYQYFVERHSLVDNRIFTINENTLQDDIIYFAFMNTEPINGAVDNIRTKEQIDDVVMKYFGVGPKRYNTGISSVTASGDVQLGSVMQDVFTINRLLLKELVDNGDGSYDAVFKLYQIQAGAAPQDFDKKILEDDAEMAVYYMMDLRTTFTEVAEGESYYLKFSEFTLEPREGAFSPPPQETDYSKKVTADELKSYHGLSIGMTLDEAKTLLNLPEGSYAYSTDNYADYTTVNVDGWYYTFRTLPKVESDDEAQYLMSINIRDYLDIIFRDIKLGDAYEDVIIKFPSAAEEGQTIGEPGSYFTRDYPFASTLRSVDIFVGKVHISMIFGKYNTLAWADIYSTDY